MEILSEGARLIADERERQVTQEGWTAEHDETHKLGELATAGAVYALWERWQFAEILGRSLLRSILWPWDEQSLKPAPYPEDGPVTVDMRYDRRIRNLVKAGALIAAEIDRLTRLGEVSAQHCRPRHHA